MSSTPSSLAPLSLLEHLDIGVVILDADYQVTFWNQFMSNHSGILAEQILNRSLFSQFDDLDNHWFRRKLRTTWTLQNPTFVTWEERPWLFPFQCYRPFTASTSNMYQNITLHPIIDHQDQVTQLAIFVYDVTDEAISKQALQKANDALNQLSITDRLTQLHNRGYWEQCLEREFERFVRTQHPTTLMMLDVDHFKQVNDQLGHLAGDAVLIHLAKEIKTMIRSTDIAGRFGGEEFGVILPNTPAVNAEILAERLRYKIETTPIPYEDETLLVTISLGLAEADSLYLTHHHWLKKADEALYHAKRHGRNQFITI